ncbi:hypothetical protein [Oribacterium sp. WCC10]|uniref:hypothetical protein n=1 Tax=Oribacterium sp. WCC10 TaxID=1855343 RepID=UPI0008E206FB|nr:hypothetical protein [Oribacterium sp. WCC10]SFG06043.1 hypothetical protein SAMN05216356_10130 [Oribacterium sp. WCC10]
MEKNKLFRKKSYEHINSPEKLDQFLSIPGPNTWALIAALIIAVSSAILWGIFGSVPETVRAVGIRTPKGITCFVSAQEAHRVKPGMKIIIKDDDDSIGGIVDFVGMSVSYDNAGKAVNAPWLLENNLNETEWVSSVIVTVKDNDKEKLSVNAELDARIIVDERTPYEILME